jgi:hypothetical protein
MKAHANGLDGCISSEKIAGTAATSRGWKVVSALAAKWGESGSS